MRHKKNKKYKNDDEKRIWFDSKKAWCKARDAQEKLNKAKAKVSFLKYDENGKLKGLDFDDD